MAPAIVRRISKSTFAAIDEVDLRLRTRTPGVTVLAYHDVGGSHAGAVDLDVDEFDRQIDYLVNVHRVVSLDEAVDLLEAGEPLPEPVVAITFDDGTAGFVDNAVPVLARHGAPATLYLATRWVDEEIPFWGAGKALTWSALADSLASGVVSIGSHSHDHRLFDRTDAADLAEDLDRSIELIGEELGVSPHHFAYPKALPPSPEAAVEVEKRFRSAALAGGRANRIGSTDLQRLDRTPIQRSDTAPLFKRKAAGGMVAEAWLRGAIAGFRYRRAAV